jgi:hypothetical protein
LREGLWAAPDERRMSVHICIWSSSNLGKTVLKRKEEGGYSEMKNFEIELQEMIIDLPNSSFAGRN